MIDRTTLSPAKRALLEKRLGRKLALDADPKVITPRSDRSRWPLTFEQDRLLSIARSEGRLTYYSNAFRIAGPIDVASLESALRGVVERHEILRSTIRMIDGNLSHLVHLPCPVTLRLIDMTELPQESREEEAIKIAERMANDPFDLGEWPLYRVALLRLGDEDHFLLLTILHIIADRQSMGILFSELIALYTAFLTRQESPLPALPIQYGDYSQWQRERMSTEFEGDLSFWKKQLDGSSATLRLPTSHPRPRSLTYRGKFQFLPISDDLAGSLRAMSRQEGVTLFMTMFAVFNVLLHCYTGQEDILVGIPLAKRNRSELERLIGCFTNTLVMRTRIASDMVFRSLLQQVRDFCLDAYSHQNLPFGLLLKELHPPEEPGYLPLVQVGFGLQISNVSNAETPGLRISSRSINVDRAVWDLMMRVEESEGGLCVSLQYKTDLFSEEAANRILTHYRILLESITSSSQANVSQLIEDCAN